MAERKIIRGYIVEKRDDGSIVTIGPAGSGSVTIPSNPVQVQQQARTEDRQDAADSRDSVRTDIAISGEGRSARGETRDVEKQSFDFAKDLRAEFSKKPEVANYETVIRQFSSALKTKPTASGDQALITAYAKMLDPGSVVRDQEFNTVAGADSTLGKATAKLGKELGLDGAGMLRPEVRARVREEMLNLTRDYRISYERARSDYTANAESYGVDPVRVVGTHLGNPYRDDIQEAWGQSFPNGRGRTPDAAFADADAAQKSIPIPPEMQAEYRARLGQVRGPGDYAQLRDELDRKYGFAPNTPDQIKANQQHWQDTKGRAGNIPPVNADMQARDRLNNSMFNNPYGAAVLAAPPLAGGMDEAAGLARSVMNGTNYQVERDAANAMRQRLANQYPGATLGGALGGGVMTGYGVGAAAPGLAARLSTLAGSAGAGAAAGALESNQDRATGAGLGAVAGLGGNLAGRGIGLGVERMARPFQRNAPQLTPTDRAISSIPDPNSLDSIRTRLSDADRLGVPYALADADPRLRALAGTVSRKSLNARELAENTFDPRNRGQADRTIQGIEALAPRVDLGARKDQLFKAGSTAARPLYTNAFSRAAPVDDRVASILNTPEGKDALKRAYRIAGNEQRDPNALGFDLDEQGEVILRDMPSFETLDLVKRGLDARLSEARNPVTGNLDLRGNPELAGIEKLRQNLLGELDRINPDYKAARKEYADFASRATDLERGYNAVPGTVAPRDMSAAIADLKPGNLSEYRSGYATRLGDMVDKTRLASNPLEAIYGSPAQQQKISALFPDGANDFNTRYMLERDMSKTAQETLGGSQTAMRQSMDQIIDGNNYAGAAGDAAIDAMATGGALTARRFGADLLRKAADAQTLGMFGAEKRASEIAPALFDTSNPAQSIAYIDEVQRKLEELTRRRSAYSQTGGMMGGLTGAASISQYGGY